jgi:hypothetical protein
MEGDGLVPSVSTRVRLRHRIHELDADTLAAETYIGIQSFGILRSRCSLQIPDSSSVHTNADIREHAHVLYLDLPHFICDSDTTPSPKCESIAVQDARITRRTKQYWLLATVIRSVDLLSLIYDVHAPLGQRRSGGKYWSSLHSLTRSLTCGSLCSDRVHRSRSNPIIRLRPSRSRTPRVRVRQLQQDLQRFVCLSCFRASLLHYIHRARVMARRLRK